jgi:hypothetical protein
MKLFKFILKMLAWIFGAVLGLAGLVLGVILAGYVILYGLAVLFGIAILFLIIYGLVKLFE